MTTIREVVLRGRGPNLMTIDSLRAFAKALEVPEGEDAPPLLLRGEGDVFSAGLDLAALAGVDMGELVRVMEEGVRRLFLHPAPTVAAVNGHAVAGGCLLAQACDLRIATDEPTARIGMTGVALGIAYPPTVMRVLEHRLPRHALTRVILEAERHAPRAALALGLVDELQEAPVEAAHERLAKLAAHPRAAYAEAKHALRAPAMDIDPRSRERFEARVAKAWDPERIRRARES